MNFWLLRSTLVSSLFLLVTSEKLSTACDTVSAKSPVDTRISKKNCGCIFMKFHSVTGCEIGMSIKIKG